MNGMSLLQAMVLEPKKAFAELAERPRFLVPMLIGILVTTVATAPGVVIAYLLISVYYLLAGKITNVQRSYGQWLAFTSWTFATIFALFPAAVILGIVALIAMGRS